ncbi:gephyrin-like molybdotransferase Glp [Paenibacillus sp. GCM10027626]|uniref:molybdopterin molybdotransferase MoeA n=1 Tax=Paenibacillus sp. GCM10027626 TaxID=3273411 RepID=UPI00363D7ACA
MAKSRIAISVTEAVDLVMAHVKHFEAESVLLPHSYGRILAEPVIARHDVPPFHRALYDGFAIRSQDSAEADENRKILFRVVDHIGAGDIAGRALSHGEAVRIMTGAAMPPYADAVVMLEQAEILEAGHSFAVRKAFNAMENVSPQGEDVKAEELVIESGRFIHPGTVALLATFGYTDVKAAKKPVVGVICTGSELLEVYEPLSPGKIRNSNGPMVSAQLARIGIHSRIYKQTKDDLGICLDLIQTALSESDCIITTGGVSVGDYDYLPAIYERLGAKVLFNKVAMRPGSVTTVAVLGEQFLFGLSGNPSACYIGFEVFVRPALLKMMGCHRPFLPYTQAVLTEDFVNPNMFTRFIRAIYQFDGTLATITPAGFNQSNAVSSIARGNAMMILPGGTDKHAKGTYVGVLLLGIEEGAKEWRI